SWKFVDAFPVHILAVKTVAGSCISRELGPQIGQLLALADAIPQAIAADSAVFCGWRWCGRGHTFSVAQAMIPGSAANFSLACAMIRQIESCRIRTCPAENRLRALAYPALCAGRDRANPAVRCHELVR